MSVQGDGSGAWPLPRARPPPRVRRRGCAEEPFRRSAAPGVSRWGRIVAQNVGLVSVVRACPDRGRERPLPGAHRRTSVASARASAWCSPLQCVATSGDYVAAQRAARAVRAAAGRVGCLSDPARGPRERPARAAAGAGARWIAADETWSPKRPRISRRIRRSFPPSPSPSLFLEPRARGAAGGIWPRQLAD